MKINHNEEREKKVQELANAVLSMEAKANISQGYVYYSCNFCNKILGYYYDEIKDNPHQSDCPYLIAKDLYTGDKDEK